MSLILRDFLAPFRRVGWRVPTLLVTLSGLLAGCAGFDAQQRKWIFQAATVPVSVDPSAASEPTVYEDARAAWRWLGERAAGPDRYVFGHSLGGAIAIQLASEVNDAKGLIVEGTFTSLRDVFDSMRFGWLPLGPLITQRFDSA